MTGTKQLVPLEKLVLSKILPDMALILQVNLEDCKSGEVGHTRAWESVANGQRSAEVFYRGVDFVVSYNFINR